MYFFRYWRAVGLFIIAHMPTALTTQIIGNNIDRLLNIYWTKIFSTFSSLPKVAFTMYRPLATGIFTAPAGLDDW